MKIEIVDNRDAWLNNDGTAKGANGGTEMVAAALNKHIDPSLLEKVKIIHSRVRPHFFEDGRRHVMLFHDMADDPEVDFLHVKSNWKLFDKFVFVSNYQKQTYIERFGLPYDKCHVIPNGIVPIWPDDKSSEQLRLIYHTTPHRGLVILADVYRRLYREYGNRLHLDVFSSFEIYNRSEQNGYYAALFDSLNEADGVTYHGYQSNDVVRNALMDAHIFAYPCIWPETSCIAAIEAQSAGCQVVCPDLGALPETVRENVGIYKFVDNRREHAQLFYEKMKFIIDNFDIFLHGRDAALDAIDGMHGWDVVIPQWENILKKVIDDTD